VGFAELRYGVHECCVLPFTLQRRYQIIQGRKIEKWHQLSRTGVTHLLQEASVTAWG